MDITAMKMQLRERLDSRKTERSRLMPKAMEEVHDELDSTHRSHNPVMEDDEDEDVELTIEDGEQAKERMRKTGVVWMKEERI